jgi:hypothetical protein
MTVVMLAHSVNFNGYLRRDRVVNPRNRTAFPSIPLPVFTKYYRIRCLAMPLLACLFTYYPFGKAHNRLIVSLELPK